MRIKINFLTRILRLISHLIHFLYFVLNLIIFKSKYSTFKKARIGFWSVEDSWSIGAGLASVPLVPVTTAVVIVRLVEASVLPSWGAGKEIEVEVEIVCVEDA